LPFYTQLFRLLAEGCGRYHRPVNRIAIYRSVVGMVFDIGCLRVKLIFSRGNYDTHSNEHKSDVAERVLITKASVCVRNEPLHSAVEWR